MRYNARVRASVTSHIGKIESQNSDNFYINGRFMFKQDLDNVQVCIEKNSDNFIFSVSDYMDIIDKDKQVYISITKEIKKYHEKLRNSEVTLEDRIEQLSDIVKENNNLIKSIYSDKDDNIQPSFASLLMKDDKVSVMSLGNCKVFIIRDGIIKQLTVDWEKTQRLLKLGIITNEQANSLANKFGIPTEGSINEILKSDEFTTNPGDIFVLTTKGITNSIEIEDINEIFEKNNDIDEAVNLLVERALKEGGNDNLTVMAIKIDKISGYGKETKVKRRRKKRYTLKDSSVADLLSGFKNIHFTRAYTIIIVCLLLFAFVFGGTKLVKSISNSKKNTDVLNNPINQNDNSNTQNLNNDNDNSESESNNINDTSSENVTDNIEEDNKILPALYTVKQGDTLYKISELFYNDANMYKIIMEKNNITSPTKIQIGQVLEIPELDN